MKVYVRSEQDDIRTQFLPLMCENTHIREDKRSECTNILQWRLWLFMKLFIESISSNIVELFELRMQHYLHNNFDGKAKMNDKEHK